MSACYYYIDSLLLIHYDMRQAAEAGAHSAHTSSALLPREPPAAAQVEAEAAVAEACGVLATCEQRREREVGGCVRGAAALASTDYTGARASTTA